MALKDENFIQKTVQETQLSKEIVIAALKKIAGD